MEEYWNGIWSNADIAKYISYVKGYVTWKPDFMKIFVEHGVKIVCDAACGFGAYSVMLAKNGFDVCGFDVSNEAVQLTRQILQKFSCAVGEYKTCSITNIKFDNSSFDAVVAHAVIDHLSWESAKIALEELFRIIKSGGLLYLSFDPMGEDDERRTHKKCPDGSRVYEDGLLFRHYTDEDICLLINGRNVIWSNTNTRGEREFVLQK